MDGRFGKVTMDRHLLTSANGRVDYHRAGLWTDLESRKPQSTEVAWRAGVPARDCVFVRADGRRRVFSFGDGLLHGRVLQYPQSPSQEQGSDDSGFRFDSRSRTRRLRPRYVRQSGRQDSRQDGRYDRLLDGLLPDSRDARCGRFGDVRNAPGIFCCDFDARDSRDRNCSRDRNSSRD
jgi:hypothetical protein